MLSFIGGHGGSRTHNFPLRRRALYPIEVTYPYHPQLRDKKLLHGKLPKDICLDTTYPTYCV